LNDFGLDGSQFVSRVAEMRTQQLDFDQVLSDPTAYGGFGATSRGISAVDNFVVSTAASTIPTTTLEIMPTFDVELKAGTTTTLVEGGQGILLGRMGASSPTSEALLEFPLSTLPPGARVVDATLVLSPNVTLNTPQLRVRGYEGDGLASTQDAAAALTTLRSTFSYEGTAAASIPLDVNSLDSLLTDSTHLGLRVSNTTPDNSMFINGLESFFPNKHKLVLKYYLPDGPSDFDTDGDVDGGDLLMWRTAFDRSLEADADGDFDVDGEDFLLWQRNLGGASAAASSAAVPEPSAATLVLVLASLAPTIRRTASRR
jgi:hypothetical protein